MYRTPNAKLTVESSKILAKLIKANQVTPDMCHLQPEPFFGMDCVATNRNKDGDRLLIYRENGETKHCWE